MKKILIVFFVVLMISSVIYAQQSGHKQDVPEGMEAIQIGGSGWLIIPKGAKTKKVGAQIIVEGVREYMSRRFEENDQRLEKIEKAIEALRTEIQSLKQHDQIIK